MWLARRDLSSPDALRRIAWAGGAAAIGGVAVSTVAVQLLGPAADTGAWRLATGVAHGQMPLWLVSSIGGAMVVIVGCIALGRCSPRRVGWLTACGRLALTLYITHIVVLVVVEPRGGFSPLQGAATTVALIAAAIAVDWESRRLERVVDPRHSADFVSRFRDRSSTAPLTVPRAEP